ncbi:unnamed protein product [Ceutorhynchus assimilis]|uniref:Uncharacterized protein n=1 Tax=Ceutorhynchus assimilis TaxID=467358 RepID=A0A9N9QET0_9CUCU|nr:unnamed protein product [Ceutorhynchus assimilis]
MSAADEVATLLMQIQKAVSRSESMVILKYLDHNIQSGEEVSLQNPLEALIQELYHLKKSLDIQVGIVEKTELIKNILKYKLYEIRFEYRKEIERLQKRRESLVSKLPKAGSIVLTLKIKDTDDNIANLEETHLKNVDFMREQKVQAEKAYGQAVLAMDHNLAKLIKGYNIFSSLIEAEKSSLSHHEAQLLASKFSDEFAVFKAAIERFTELQTTGWKIVYQEEKIVDMLQERGLKVLLTGELVTDDGHQITFRQARDSKLFDNIGPIFLKVIRNHLNEEPGSDEDSSSSRSTLSRQSSSAERIPRVFSTDITFLRDRLGKPLTLALHEVVTIQPSEPIHYLSHWLFKYRYNSQIENPNSEQYEYLNNKRNQLIEEKSKKRTTDEVMATILEMVDTAAAIAAMNAFITKKEK